MRPLCLRISFLATSNHRFLKNSHCLAFSTVTNFSNRRYEDEGRIVRVSVWWDFENCGLPLNTNPFRVAQSITNAVRSNGIKGPIQITAFGDVMQISRTNQEALSATGINLCHVPSGGKNSADRSLLVDLMYWVSQNPPPAHIFLISGDRDFAGILHKLRMNNYNILLASRETAPSVLCSAATIMWPWSSLLRGGNLNGKLFNQPPDGPYNSWYGQFKAPIEDPFVIMGQSSCISTDESSELAGDTKVRPIPKVVVNHIRRILNSYPEGIDISLLRTELSQSNLVIDADLYGYRKFSRFLSAMPNILKILPSSSGQFVVRGVNTKFPDESVSTTYIEQPNSNGESADGSFLQPNGDISSGEDITEGSTIHISSKRKVKQSTNLLEGEKQHKSSSLMNTQGMKAKASANNLQDIKKEEEMKESSNNMAEGSTVHPSETKVRARSINLHEGEKRHQSSSLMNTRRIKAKASSKNLEDLIKEMKLKEPSEQKYLQEIGEQDSNLQEKTEKVKRASPFVEIKDSAEKEKNGVLGPDELCTASESGIFRRLWMKWFASRGKDSMEKNIKEHEDTKSGRDNVKEEALTSCGSSEFVGPALFSPSSHEALNNEGKVPRNDDAVAELSGQGSSLADQAIDWFEFPSSQKYDDEVDRKDENNDRTKHNPNNLELFSKAAFWFEMELFIGTSQCAAVLSHSQTREHLAENLQKQGPPVIRSLSKPDLLHLVDLLISEKKWVEECSSQIFPFRLAPPGKEPSTKPPFRSNGLSHIFSDSQLNVQESGEKKAQNPPYAAVQHRGSASKPRVEMFVDCQKLIDQILKEHPEGTHMGTFRKLFLDRHGYALDLKKLGYEKLINLLHIMPGVKIEYNMILPAGVREGLNVGMPIQENKVNSVNDLQRESLDDDGWDELGPVDNSDAGKQGTYASLTRKSKKGTTEHKCTDFEPLNEDEYSDSEEEKSSESETDAKAKLDAQKSSLLEILDSWCSDKDGKLVAETTMGMKVDPPGVNPVRRPKPSKTYTFVSEQASDSKDKLVDGILGSLKRSSERSSESRLVG